MKKTNIESVVRKFTRELQPGHRYASFDYCYNYFRTTKNPDKDMEKSCLTLGYYLASWGMYRGSSFVLQNSLQLYKPAITYIASLDKSVWDFDVDTYDKASIEQIVDIYRAIKERLILNHNADLTLITKTLLVVFGFIPAFDQYFCNAMRLASKNECGFRRMNSKSLASIRKFYDANKASIDKLFAKSYTIDFLTGKKTRIHYPKVKIIDMYGFIAGV
jgi:hypothetical protein